VNRKPEVEKKFKKKHPPLQTVYSTQTNAYRTTGQQSAAKAMNDRRLRPKTIAAHKNLCSFTR
jgi:hypothetical protein